MTNPTDPVPDRFRLGLDDGEVVEVDGSTIMDADAGKAVPAVLVRMPGFRAHDLAHALDQLTRVGAIVAGGELVANEARLSWALDAAAAVLGDRSALRCAARVAERVTSGQRMRAAAVLQERAGFAVLTLVAVVDAAARWVDEDGHEYAIALLEATTDADTAGAAFLALTTAREERSG
jgi:hypothetical protein